MKFAGFKAIAVVTAVAFGSIGLLPTMASAGAAQVKTNQPVVERPGSALIPGQYIVTVKPGEDRRSVAATTGTLPEHVYQHALNGFSAQLNQGQLNAIRHNPAVAAVEQDQQIAVDTYYTENTDSSGQPWGLDRIDQHTGLSRSYSYWVSGSYGAGSGVRAYVIDTGIATADADFGGRALDVYDAMGGNGQDCNGHGSHVAGTIGGGTYGVAKSVLLRGVRVLDCTGHGSVSTIIAGIDWVAANAIKPAVANISVGGPYSQAENDAVTRLVNSGVFVSVAGGNDSSDACTKSPSSAAGTITVAAADSTDTRANFSNYGACVDLYAPGVNVKSDYLNGGVQTMSGTSMASPHVAGVAALLKSDYGDQTSSTISSWILNATTPNAIKGNITGTPNRMLFMSGW